MPHKGMYMRFVLEYPPELSTNLVIVARGDDMPWIDHLNKLAFKNQLACMGDTKLPPHVHPRILLQVPVGP